MNFMTSMLSLLHLFSRIRIINLQEFGNGETQLLIGICYRFIAVEEGSCADNVRNEYLRF